AADRQPPGHLGVRAGDPGVPQPIELPPGRLSQFMPTADLLTDYARSGQRAPERGVVYSAQGDALAEAVQDRDRAGLRSVLFEGPRSGVEHVQRGPGDAVVDGGEQTSVR